MKKISILLVAVMMFSNTSNAQKSYPDYLNAWKKVTKFELKVLPKSALAEVEKIYELAKKDENAPQIIKTLLFKSKYALILEENAKLKVIDEIKSEISQSKFPTKNILESILADLYWQYFQQNRWKFYNRTKTAVKIDTSDFRTWDLQTIFEETHTHFQNSLQNGLELQLTNLKQFNEILNLLAGSKLFRPSLYDFIANRALDFYKNEERNLSRPAYKFEIKNISYLSDNKLFTSIIIDSKDTISQHLHALKIFKNLALFHSRDTNSRALISTTIERLQFVKNNSIIDHKDRLYLETLQQLKEVYKNDDHSAEISFQIATFLNDQGKKYQPGSDDKNRFKLKEALTICEEAIKSFPKALGTKKCMRLKKHILEKTIRLKSEKYVPINRASRLLVKYKNIDSLNFSAFKLSKKQQIAFHKIINDSIKLAFVKRLSPEKNWQVKLRNELDYQEHSTEIIVPPLLQGTYLIFASPDNEVLNTEKMFSYSFVQITNLAIVESYDNSTYIYQIVDRNTGKPIKKAKVNLKNNNTGRYNKLINRSFTTDKNGQFFLKNKYSHSNVVATVTYKDDYATFGNYYLYKSQNDNVSNSQEDIHIKSFIFTDRSIYRPGQTVHFKAIFLKKQGDKTSVFTDEYVEILLEDPNGQDVGQLDLKLNKYGAVSGTFILPSNGLTGEYVISADESYEHGSKFYDDADYEFSYDDKIIAVEEYKRPKFKTDFLPLTESYKLNDSVVIKGNAKAFSGSSISHAKVTYRVVRTAIFPRWCYWRSPNFYQSEKLEVTHGETVTDTNGDYHITFKAIPDLKVSKENQPTFNYKVYADVTDINGETRSTETVVKIGYHTLITKVSIESKLDKLKKDHKMSIYTTNLNGEFVGTKGTIKVYKLQSPENPLRKRPWKAPDYNDIPESVFRKLFPNDPYSNNEGDEMNWKKGTLVYQELFDTNTSKELALGSIKKWVSGKYIVVAESNDKFGQAVKDEQYFSIFSKRERRIPDNKLFYINTNKSQYSSNEMVELRVGSASKNLTVTLNVEKNYKIVSSHFIHLNNESKIIYIPVNQEDIGGFAINYHFVNYNSFENGHIKIAVPFHQDHLQIETLTFRDKIKPGSEQTWSFSVKGVHKDKATAEILAGMYDASLDEFKDHQWNFNPIERQQYYSYPKSTANYSFGIQSFVVRNQFRGYFISPIQYYDQLDWFGFDLNANRWTNNLYLRRLKEESKDEREHFDKIVSGIIEDESGRLPGVNVIIKGTNFGTQTDFDGQYAIRVKKGDELEFSFIGYTTSSIIVGEGSEINISLMADEELLEEVVVTGYGYTKKSELTGSVALYDHVELTEDSEVSEIIGGKVAGVNITKKSDPTVGFLIRGTGSNNDSNLLYIVDGVPVEKFDLQGNDVLSIQILKDPKATAIYGTKGANGVILITTKSGQKRLDAELSNVKARKNLQETAFFYPHLTTDKEGTVSFNFTVPEALTRWKLQLLAHTKDLASATKTLSAVTQKELMVMPNPPRFLREGDEIIFSAKISNLTDKILNGTARLALTDALTGKEINARLNNRTPDKAFEVTAKGNSAVSWTLQVPDAVQAVEYKIVAKAGAFSDGEQNVLPVLSNRLLVTETLPMWVRSNQTKTFSLDKLKNNTSTTLRHHKLSLEMTSNPAWYAVQSLPYLMEYPYECAEQTFARYYANALGSHIVNSNPRIQEVFNQWKSSDALLSNLEKNPELKSVIISETPWLRDAQSESAQKKRIALLFDLNTMNNQLSSTISKLKQMQFSNGGFPWFKGNNYPNRYITQHIAGGFGHLNKLSVFKYTKESSNEKITAMMKKAVHFLDDEIIEDYTKLLKEADKIQKKSKTKAEGTKKRAKYLSNNHLDRTQLHYLYVRSFYKDLKTTDKLQSAIDYYTNQAASYWKSQRLYSKGLIALVLHRSERNSVVKAILKSLKENSISSEELGMFWKENTAGWYWYEAPVETQSLLIEVFAEIENDPKIVDELKVWLLKNKQTNRWKTTKATTEAVYALLLKGSDWLSLNEAVEVKIGQQKIEPSSMENVKIEAGTGYFKTSWSGNEVLPEMGEITITKKDKGIAWGGLYWQYFEDLDKITHAKTPLELTKKLFLKTNTDSGELLTEINKKTVLRVGDLITARIELKADRNMEFIHMKDMRASGLEPVNVLSEYKWQDNLGYYQSTKDASTNFFMDVVPKGVYVFEYDLRVNNAGGFSNGITTIQSMYAPEFSSHSEGVRINIVE